MDSYPRPRLHPFKVMAHLNNLKILLNIKPKMGSSKSNRAMYSKTDALLFKNHWALVAIRMSGLSKIKSKLPIVEHAKTTRLYVPHQIESTGCSEDPR